MCQRINEGGARCGEEAHKKNIAAQQAYTEASARKGVHEPPQVDPITSITNTEKYPPETLREHTDALIESHPHVKTYIRTYEDEKLIELQNIQVPKEHRGNGYAQKYMKHLIELADNQGWEISLTPSSDFGSSKPKLTAWYKSLGFVNNSGRAKNFITRETMIRIPSKR